MDGAFSNGGVETDRIRDLLASDRRLVGQARVQRSQAPLHTATFHQPLRVRVRRRWRHDRSLRVRTLYSGVVVLLVAVLCLGLWLRGRSYTVQLPWFAALPSGASLEREPTELVPELLLKDTLSEPEPEPEREPDMSKEEDAAISAARRVQRADVWLRVGTPQAAREARRLLEGALAELPGSVHGQVSLAEACLRLADEACARRAIHTAVLARPWRSKYRALAERIDQAFTRGDAIVGSGGPVSVDNRAPAPEAGRQRR